MPKVLLSQQQIQSVVSMYHTNVTEFGDPKYSLIIAEFASKNPPIHLTKQSIFYHAKKSSSKIASQSAVIEPNLKPTNRKKNKPTHNLFLPKEVQSSIISSPLGNDSDAVLSNPRNQIASLLEATRKKKEVETQILERRLAIMDGKLLPIEEIEEEKTTVFQSIERSFDSLIESFFNEGESLLLKEDRSGAKSVLVKRKYDLLFDIESSIFKNNHTDSTPSIELKKRFQNPIDWAEENRVMADGDSPWPGRFSYKLVPFMRELVECFSEDSPVREVVLKKGAQVMGTTCLTENILGYYIDQHPCNMLVVAPTVQLLDLNVQPRIIRMIKGAGLEKLLTHAPKRNLIKFKGGQLFFAGSTSPDRFRNISVKILILEELAGFPQNSLKEGSVKDLAISRTRVFEKSRKILYISSALKNGDDIDTLFLSGDCRYFNVPCPHCNTPQVLLFDNLKYNINEKGKVKNVHYQCSECNESIEETEKQNMFDNGFWRSTKPENEILTIRSYHLSGLYSPYGLQSWNEICQLYEDAKESEEKIQVFRNTVLGENYSRTKISTPNLVDLLSKSHNSRVVYQRGVSPQAILYLTVGVDVQKDRLELELVGWCKDKINFSIEYYIFYGNPDLLEDPSGCWSQLKSLQEKIALMSIPTVWMIDAGDQPMRVYDYIEKVCPEPWTFPIIGESRPGLSYPYRARPVDGYADMERLHINTGYLKTLFFNDSFQLLPKEGLPPRYVGLPSDYDKKHLESLYLSERPDLKLKNGKEVVEWKQLKSNNHMLDCRVYAIAGAFWIRDYISKNILGLVKTDSIGVEDYLISSGGEKIVNLKDGL